MVESAEAACHPSNARTVEPAWPSSPPEPRGLPVGPPPELQSLPPDLPSTQPEIDMGVKPTPAAPLETTPDSQRAPTDFKIPTVAKNPNGVEDSAEAKDLGLREALSPQKGTQPRIDARIDLGEQRAQPAVLDAQFAMAGTARTAKPNIAKPSLPAERSDRTLVEGGSPTRADDSQRSMPSVEASAPAEPEGPNPVTPKIPAETNLNSGVSPPAIRQISLKLAGPGSANVDVQVTEKAGKVLVAVRAQDPHLTQSLQRGLGDLVGRLQDRGYKAEAWIPGAGHVSATSAPEPGNPSNSQDRSGQGDPGTGQHNSQGQTGSGDANRRQPGRWTAELDETLQSAGGENQ